MFDSIRYVEDDELKMEGRMVKETTIAPVPRKVTVGWFGASRMRMSELSKVVIRCHRSVLATPRRDGLSG